MGSDESKAGPPPGGSGSASPSPLFLLQLGGPATHPTPRWAAPYFGEEAGAREVSLEGADGYCTFILSLALF